MSITYNEVLERLREERHRLVWSQKEMSRCVHMSQSNYSKIELGLRRLSFDELKHLCESEVDVHYIYTAMKSNSQYADFFRQCSYSELICYLSIIYSIVVLRYRKENTLQWKRFFDKTKYIPLIEENQRSNNIFMVIRRSINCQQQKMAEEIGVDVKKLRDLENGRSLPDSELLFRLYKMFHIPPFAILKDRKGLISEISILLELLERENLKGIFDIIRTIHEMN